MSAALQEAVLSGLLTYGQKAWSKNLGTLHPDLFIGKYREVYQVIEQRYSDGQVVDLFMLHEALPENEALNGIGKSFCGRSTLPGYIAELRQACTERQAAMIGTELMRDKNVLGAIQKLQGLGGHKAEYHPVSAVISPWLENLSNLVENPDPGLQTGWRAIDELLGGIRGGNLTVIAARPSMGKTAAALNIALQLEKPVLIFSLEMTESEVVDRLISAQRIDHAKLRKPDMLTDVDWPRVTSAIKRLSEKSILINDTGGISMEMIEGLSQRAHQTHGLRLIVIDYLQLVKVKAESRFQEVSEVSRRLKALAKNLHVPVLALSQLNRGAENKSAPTLADLRESGQIEQDADQVLFIQREEVINPDTNRPGTADIYIRKNRHGQTGKETLSWQGHFQLFSDYQPR